MRDKRYFSERSIIKASENMIKRLSMPSAQRSCRAPEGSRSASKSASELRAAFRKAAERLA